MDLSCNEEMPSLSKSPECQGQLLQEGQLGHLASASKEPHLMNDPRVLHQMLKSEHNIPAIPYFKSVQTEITPEMRVMVTNWMFEVCEEEHVPECVFLRAVTYFDRFLGKQKIQKEHLQLLAATCLLISSKWSGSIILGLESIKMYSANSLTSKAVKEWEMMLLTIFKWNVYTITSSDFVEPILHRIPGQGPWDSDNFKDKIKTFNAYCAMDFWFCGLPPSAVAGVSIASAVSTLVNQEGLEFIMGQICLVTGMAMDVLKTAKEQLEEKIVNMDAGQRERYLSTDSGMEMDAMDGVSDMEDSDSPNTN